MKEIKWAILVLIQCGIILLLLLCYVNSERVSDDKYKYGFEEGIINGSPVPCNICDWRKEVEE